MPFKKQLFTRPFYFAFICWLTPLSASDQQIHIADDIALQTPLFQKTVAVNAVRTDSISRKAPRLIGKITVLQGQGWVIRSNEKREDLSTGLAVREGDSIHTEHQSKAQINFTDDSIVTINQSTQINIEEFKWNNSNQTGSFVMDFIKGTFRAISGLIGKTVPQNYSIKTSVATIGVRGTDYGARYCESSTCVIKSGDDNLTLSQGLYIAVLDGQVSSTSEGRETLINADEAIYQKDSTSAAKPIENLPGLVFNADELQTYHSAPKVEAVAMAETEAEIPFYGAFLLSSTGKPVRDSFGRCISSSQYRTDHNVTECQ